MRKIMNKTLHKKSLKKKSLKKKSLKKNKINLEKYKIPEAKLHKQNLLVYIKHKLNRSSINCNLWDYVKNMSLLCEKAPVTGRGLKSYQKHLFPDIKNVFGYLKSKSFLDIGCGINHIYKEALLYQLIQKKYKALGMDLYKFPEKHPNFKSGNILDTKLPSNSFDVITSQYFIYYWMDNVKDLLNAFIELNRILKKKGEIRIYPVYFGNFHYNDDKLLEYLIKHFHIQVKYPKFYKERVAYIYKGEGEKDIKKTDISVGNKEESDANSLNASILILKKK